FSSEASPRRTISSGMRVECKWPSAPDYRVICKKNFGLIEQSEARLCCPNCVKGNKITPVTVGFMMYKYRIQGIKESDEQHISEWKEAKQDDFYQFFDPSK
ncbi:hypothetical protein BGZ79_008651, partial [Entomortierella chlamydospora]